MGSTSLGGTRRSGGYDGRPGRADTPGAGRDWTWDGYAGGKGGGDQEEAGVGKGPQLRALSEGAPAAQECAPRVQKQRAR